MYQRSREIVTEEARLLRFIARRLHQGQHCWQIIAEAGQLMSSTSFGPTIQSIKRLGLGGKKRLFEAMEETHSFSPSTVFLLRTGVQYCGWFVPFLDLSATLLEEIVDLRVDNKVVYPKYFETMVDLFTLAFLVSREDSELFLAFRTVAEHGSESNRIAFGNLACEVERRNTFADALEQCSPDEQVVLPRVLHGSLSAFTITEQIRQAESMHRLPAYLESLTDELASLVLNGLHLFPTIPRSIPMAEVASEA